MTIRFRKRVRLLPGLWLNLSKSGLSTSIGGKGATVTIGKNGTRSTLNVPGTGLSYTTALAPLPRATLALRSGAFARVVAIVLWTFLIGYLSWAMHRLKAIP